MKNESEGDREVPSERGRGRARLRDSDNDYSSIMNHFAERTEKLRERYNIPLRGRNYIPVFRRENREFLQSDRRRDLKEFRKLESKRIK